MQGDPVYTQELTISKSVKLLTFDLTTPYYITGEEEELYIGYTAEISTSYKLLSADFATELENCCFAWGDEGWTDTYGTGAGGANIQLNIDDADSFTDVMMAKADMDGYLQSGGKYAFNANVFNFGTETVNDLDVKLTIDGQSSTFRFSDLNLVQGGSTSLTLPEYEATVSGNVEVNIEVTAVNGNADDDVADNVVLSSLFFYPENMERALLVEEFTSQSCSNCPCGGGDAPLWLCPRHIHHGRRLSIHLLLRFQQHLCPCSDDQSPVQPLGVAGAGHQRRLQLYQPDPGIC